MATFQKSEEITAWQKARELTREVYDLSGKGSFGKDFVLRDQARRASVSIMANIAEGFERGGTKEFLQFLSIAKGSAGELRSHLCVALDLGYINRPDHQKLTASVRETGRLINGLMTYLRKTPIKGAKYRVREDSELYTPELPESWTFNFKLST